MRIVTLIASATETVCALDLRDQLIGRSHECDHPASVKTLPVLSRPKVNPGQPGAVVDRQVRDIVRDGLSVYSIEVGELERLKPDLIVTQDHCEVCAVSLKDVEDALCSITNMDASICTLHPGNLADVRRDFQAVADAAGVSERGRGLVARFDHTLAQLATQVRGFPQPKVALIEWLEPPMIAGGWMPELARIAGTEPVIVTQPDAFQTVTWDDIAAADPDIAVILPCGYDVEKTLTELRQRELADMVRKIPAVANNRCFVADGNAYFNRPGPRLADSAELLAAIAHSDRLPHLVDRYAGTYTVWQ